MKPNIISQNPNPYELLNQTQAFEKSPKLHHQYLAARNDENWNIANLWEIILIG